MECKSNADIHGDGHEKPRIKEETFNPDEMVTEIQTPHIQENDKLFVSCVQSSDGEAKIEIKQEILDPNVASNDIKSNLNQPYICLGTVAIKGDDDIEIKEHGIQDEASPESQEHETYFMKHNMSSGLGTKVELKQEALIADGVSIDIKCEPEQPPILDHVPFLCTGPIKAEDEIYIKEGLWSCVETPDESLNERRGNGSKKNVAADGMLLLELSRTHRDAMQSSNATQLQENKHTSSLSAEYNTTAQKCGTKQRCKTYRKMFKLLSHSKQHDLVPEECQGRNCDRNYTASGVSTDQLIHSNRRQYLCSTCGKTFTKLQNFKVHLSVHDDKRRYKCQICEKSFKRIDVLKTHFLVHDDKRQFKCTICATSFKRLANLKSHLLVHDDKRQYKCQICEKSFKRLDVLKMHLLVHDDKNKYKCLKCGESFKCLSSLKTHLLAHDDKRQYKCETCAISFNQIENLKSHLLEHDDKRQFNCAICAASFKRLANLKSHLLIHDDKRQYKCQICDRSFKRLDALKRHILVHDYRNKYKCQKCEKSLGHSE